MDQIQGKKIKCYKLIYRFQKITFQPKMHISYHFDENLYQKSMVKVHIQFFVKIKGFQNDSD